MMAFTTESLMDEYPDVNESIVYLDSASKTVLPESVSQFGIAALLAKCSPWYGMPGRDIVDDVRKKFAALINAEPVSIGYAHSTSMAMSTAAKNLLEHHLGPNKCILVLENEMGSGILPFQHASKAVGANLRVVKSPLTSGKKDWTTAIADNLDNSVTALCIPNVHWCDGSLVDLVAVRKLLDEKFDSPPLLLIDGTQSIGAMPFDVAAIRPTFVACSSQKWLNAPYGLSLMYLDPKYHDSWMPLDMHDRNRVGCDNTVTWDEVGVMNNDSGYPEAFMPGARRLDDGGHPNPVMFSTLSQSLELVLTWSPAGIQQALTALTDQLVSEVAKHPVLTGMFHTWPKSARSGHIVGLRLRKPWAETNMLSLSAIGSELKKKNVFVSIRGGAIRVSPYIFNRPEHISRFVSALAEVVQGMTSVDTLENASNAEAHRVLIIGAAGWLAQFVWHEMAQGCQPSLQDSNAYVHVYGSYHNTEPLWIPKERRLHLDIADKVECEKVLNIVKPHVIIHLAAVTSPAACQKDQVHAGKVNKPDTFIESLKKIVPECAYIFTSTDLVYDGEKPPYVPELSGLSDSRPELTTPSTVYGATKLDCEREVLSLQKGIVLRLSNMIGRPYVYRPSGKKFAQFLYESLVSKEYIGLRCDEYRSFVGVEDVSKILIRIAMMAITTSTDVNADQSDHKSSAQIYRKIYNVGGPTGLSRLQLATIFAGVCGTTIEVKEKTSSNDCDKVHSSAGAWVVFPQLNLDTVVSSGIANPRDVTMIMTDTEQTFGYSFSSMEEVLSESLSYFKNFFL